MQPLVDAISAHAAENGHRSAFSDGQTALTWAELASAVGGLAAELVRSDARVVGVFAPNGPGWAVAQLSAALAGKVVVPLPTFFSSTQLGHIVRDASVDLLLATSETWPRAIQSGVKARLVSLRRSHETIPAHASGFSQVIYTSGSTGAPKGVRLGATQVLWSARALAKATGATAQDRYLSVLPLPLLLESLCAVFIPTLVGASVTFAAGAADQVGKGVAPALADAFEAARPTMSVLVPQLLKSWTLELAARSMTAPSSLRFVAVGGAPISATVADGAWRLGVPAHEGYGLSECCSVVSLNRPGERMSGTVGRPLDGLAVSIEQGEIVVDSPSVMDGYLGKPPVAGPWRTGDLGEIDADGRLSVIGRKDNLMVTAFGRNVSPEWIEAEIAVSPKVALSVVTGHGEPRLSAILVPTRAGQAWFDQASPAEVEAFGRRLCADLPAYAVPSRWLAVAMDDALARGLVTSTGGVRRDAAAGLFTETAPKPECGGAFRTEAKMSFYDRLVAETAAERNAFLAIPLIQQTLKSGAPPEVYAAFLGQAYHHVRHTFPLLALAASLTTDERYQDALVEYMEEERGHEKWILDDIAAVGGDAAAVRDGEPGHACRVMVGYAYYAIERISPWAMLGSVHVLEGMSVLLADRVADAMQSRVAAKEGDGFSYLRSHGGLDVEHVAFFRTLADSIEDPEVQRIVIEQSKTFYRLYGQIFRDLEFDAALSYAA